MTDQLRYDELLLRSHVNVVRGEDSIVRAMLTGNPFIWQIYPQADRVHLKKLNSLFDRMLEFLPADYSDQINKIRHINLYINSASDFPEINLSLFYKDWEKVCNLWSEYILNLGSYTDNLLYFINSKF